MWYCSKKVETILVLLSVENQAMIEYGGNYGTRCVRNQGK